MKVEPVSLLGRVVDLVPLERTHVPGLTAAGKDDAIWQLMPYGPVTNEERMTWFVEQVLARQSRGTDLPFAVIERSSGQVVGCTRYLDIQPANRGLEIGGTWYAVAHQRTGVNTECKFLLLRHAFETLGSIRVQFKTDLRNERSQRALERIGATREGVLRQNLIMPDGYYRSSVYYSILEQEWPGVKAHLQALMNRS
jgi:RimJ/RimL family protein N-acetyltransferase